MSTSLVVRNCVLILCGMTEMRDNRSFSMLATFGTYLITIHLCSKRMGVVYNFSTFIWEKLSVLSSTS